VTRLITLVLLLAATGCKGSSTSPAPTPGDFSIAVTSPNANIFLGATEQMTAAASDGRTLTGTWGTDTPTVASVNGTGLVTAVSAGLANIFFIADGRQGTKSVRALPNFAGTFSGNYRVTNCTESGQVAAADVCKNAPAGTRVPFTFIFSQTGSVIAGRVLVIGTDTLPPFSATIGAGGDVTVSGSVVVTGGFIVNTTWTIVQRTAGVITGTITQVWTSPGVSGQATVSGTIDSISKTASAD
jgi:hypothetical protein